MAKFSGKTHADDDDEPAKPAAAAAGASAAASQAKPAVAALIGRQGAAPDQLRAARQRAEVRDGRRRRRSRAGLTVHWRPGAAARGGSSG